jgi:hypothetical protein
MKDDRCQACREAVDFSCVSTRDTCPNREEEKISERVLSRREIRIIRQQIRENLHQ